MKIYPFKSQETNIKKILILPNENQYRIKRGDQEN